MIKKTSIVFCILLFNLSLVYSQCAQGVVPATQQAEYGYKSRGEYCEGYVKQNVSAPDLEMVQFTEGEFVYNLQQDKVLTIRPATFIRGEVFVRVASKQSKLAYRLDGSIGPNSFLSWDLRQVIIPERLEAYGLGIFAYRLSSNINRKDPKIYIPVTVGGSQGGVSSQRKPGKKIVFRSATDIEDIRWRLKYANGHTTDYTLIRPKGVSFFSKEEPIEILLPGDLEPGEYILEVAFRAKGKQRFDKKTFAIEVD